jgi:hypothetical protein
MSKMPAKKTSESSPIDRGDVMRRVAALYAQLAVLERGRRDVIPIEGWQEDQSSRTQAAELRRQIEALNVELYR